MKTEPVLSLNACIKMNLINRVDSVKSQMQTSQSVSTCVLDEFPQIFKGLGCILGEKHTIRLKEGVEPVVSNL